MPSVLLFSPQLAGAQCRYAKDTVIAPGTVADSTD